MLLSIHIHALPLSLPDGVPLRAGPIEPRGLDTTATLSARQLFALGASTAGRVLSGAGRVASKLPDKAGKQMIKQQKDNIGSASGADTKRIADIMQKNAEKASGKPQNRKCLENLAEHGMQFGLAGMSGNCNKADPKKEELDRKMAAAKQTKADPNSMAAKMDAARKKAYGLT